MYSCSNEELPKSDLIIKENIIYKRGSSVPFTGKEKSIVDNKIIEYEIKDGLKDGEFRIYYADGTLEISGQLEKNINVGKWQYFYPDGEIESEGFFEEDEPEGKWLWYYRDGKIREEGSYQSGHRIGWWYQYDGNGEIIFKKNFDIEDSTSAIDDSVFSGTKKIPF